VLGTFGDEIEEFSEELIRKRLVHVLASDAHNTRGRPPRMSEAVRVIGRWIGDDAAVRMATDIPRAFVEGRDPELPPMPEPAPKKASIFSRWLGRTSARPEDRRSRRPGSGAPLRSAG
jgi:protein-tyrosine phosphatase